MRNMPWVGVDRRNVSSTTRSIRAGSSCTRRHSSGCSARRRTISVSIFVVVSLPGDEQLLEDAQHLGYVERPVSATSGSSSSTGRCRRLVRRSSCGSTRRRRAARRSSAGTRSRRARPRRAHRSTMFVPIPAIESSDQRLKSVSRSSGTFSARAMTSTGSGTAKSVDELDRAAVDPRVDEPGRDRPDRRLQLGDRLRRERLRHEPAVPGVLRRVGREHRRDPWIALGDDRGHALAIVRRQRHRRLAERRGERLRVADDLEDEVVARDEVQAERVDAVDRRIRPHRGVVRERALQRVWVEGVERGEILSCPFLAQVPARRATTGATASIAAPPTVTKLIP